jgi:hypothetical protein
MCIAICENNFIYATVSRPALGPTQHPVQWVTGSLSLGGVKQLGGGADLSPPSSSEVKNAWSYASTPLYTIMAWCSVKAQYTKLYPEFTTWC